MHLPGGVLLRLERIDEGNNLQLTLHLLKRCPAVYGDHLRLARKQVKIVVGDLCIQVSRVT
jgi:hypothetical protein